MFEKIKEAFTFYVGQQNELLISYIKDKKYS